MEPHQRLPNQPHDMTEGPGIFVENWISAE